LHLGPSSHSPPGSTLHLVLVILYDSSLRQPFPWNKKCAEVRTARSQRGTQQIRFLRTSEEIERNKETTRIQKITRAKEMLVSHERNRSEPKNPLQHECGAISVAEHNFRKRKKRKEKENTKENF
jgi:hypothetical protein